jgi:hypothetical protein
VAPSSDCWRTLASPEKCADHPIDRRVQLGSQCSRSSRTTRFPSATSAVSIFNNRSTSRAAWLRRCNERQHCANSGHSPVAWRTRQIDTNALEPRPTEPRTATPILNRWPYAVDAEAPAKARLRSRRESLTITKLSRDGTDPATWDPALDGVLAAPENHTVLYEDEAIRVISVSIAPGAIGRSGRSRMRQWPFLRCNLQAAKRRGDCFKITAFGPLNLMGVAIRRALGGIEHGGGVAHRT